MIKLGAMMYFKSEGLPKEMVDYEGFIPFAHEMGLDVIDFHISRGCESLDRDFMRGVKLLALKHGLAMGYMGVPGGFVGSEDELRARVAQTKVAVDAAAFMGCPLIRVFGGSAAGITDREPLYPPMVRCLQEISDYAKDQGVFVGLQNHDNRNLAATADDMLRIVRETDRENFTVIMDTGQWLGSVGAHPVGESDPNVDIYADYMEKIAPLAAVVRTKFYKIDQGWEEYIDYKRVIAILKSVDFNGYLSIVYEGQQHSDCTDDEALRLAAKHLRAVLGEAGV